MSIGLISKVNAQNSWELMEPLDIHRGRLRSCVIDNMIYVFGGQGTNGVYIDSVDVYNTETNEWTDLSPMPVGFCETNVEVIHDTIYIAGGWNNDFITLNTTVAYDPEGDNYFSKENTPKATGSNASCVKNDTLYILGGKEYGNSTDVKKAWFYDPVGDDWGSLPEMNYHHGVDGTASVIDDKIYVIGGGTGLTLPMDPVQAEVFDGKMWEAIEDMPIPVLHHISVVHDNKILVFGGDRGAYSHVIGYPTNLIQEYDPATNTWRRMQGMPFNRSAMTGEKVGNYLYLMGGYSSNDRVPSNTVSEVWRFNLDSLKAFSSVTGVSLDKDSLELHGLETATLVHTVSPDDVLDPSVSWTSADPAVATVANGIVYGRAVGQTYIYVTSNDGQFMDSCLVSVTPGVGIANTKADRLSIYPNPTNDLLTIETGTDGHHAIKTNSLNGQLISSFEMEGTSHQIDLSSFQKGVYFITIRSKDFVTRRKIVKL